MPTGHPLTEEQIAWVRRHFADMRNQDLADHLGVSKSAVCDVQKRFHLKKSEAHNSKMGRKAGLASFKVQGRMPDPTAPEIVARRVETYKRTFREERARVTFGLPQKTRIKVKRQPRKKRDQKCYLKHLGYLIDDVNNVAYWTEDTHRATRLEARPKIYFKFMPYEQ